jgi:hypothetical protein
VSNYPFYTFKFLPYTKQNRLIHMYINAFNGSVIDRVVSYLTLDGIDLRLDEETRVRVVTFQSNRFARFFICPPYSELIIGLYPIGTCEYD